MDGLAARVDPGPGMVGEEREQLMRMLVDEVDAICRVDGLRGELVEVLQDAVGMLDLAEEPRAPIAGCGVEGAQDGGVQVAGDDVGSFGGFDRVVAGEEGTGGGVAYPLTED